MIWYNQGGREITPEEVYRIKQLQWPNGNYATKEGKHGKSTSWPRPRYLKERGKWRRTKPKPSSERRRSAVSLGLLLDSFLGFSLTPTTLFETFSPPTPPLLLLELRLEGAEDEDEDDGQSRDQCPGRPHLKQPVGAAAADFVFSISLCGLCWNQI